MFAIYILREGGGGDTLTSIGVNVCYIYTKREGETLTSIGAIVCYIYILYTV